MTVDACFTHDEYGRSRSYRLEQADAGRLVPYPDSLSAHAYRDILDRLLDAAGTDRPLRITGAHGESLWGVNVRTVEYDGKLLVNLVNFLREGQIVQLDLETPPKRITNLFNNAEVTLPLSLESLDPLLLSVEFSTTE